MALNVVMLGPPGAGKGTQAERLARERGIPKISTGDILREAVEAGTELGRLAQATMAAGRLVSDEIMNGIVRERLQRPDAARGFVLDGFPRTVAQAKFLDALVADRGALIVIEIQVPVEELVRRLAGRRLCTACGAIVGHLDGAETRGSCPRCGGRLVARPDDDPGVVRERLRVYERETEPLVEYYRPRPTFFTVDGHQSPDRVAAAIARVVALVAAQDGRATGAADAAVGTETR